MVQPLHSSFTLRPSNTTVRGQELTLRSPSIDVSAAAWQKTWTRKRVITFDSSAGTSTTTGGVGGEGATKKQPITLPSAFEPPSDENYWKKRCHYMQDICQQTRKRMREMEEDQRQLRRRIWQLEEKLSLDQSNNNKECNVTTTSATATKNDPEVTSKVPVSEASTSCADQPPVRFVHIPVSNDSKCCFYLTDGEGLSDWDGDDEDDYDDDGYESDDYRDEDDCSRQHR